MDIDASIVNYAEAVSNRLREERILQLMARSSFMMAKGSSTLHVRSNIAWTPME